MVSTIASLVFGVTRNRPEIIAPVEDVEAPSSNTGGLSMYIPSLTICCCMGERGSLAFLSRDCDRGSLSLEPCFLTKPGRLGLLTLSIPGILDRRTSATEVIGELLGEVLDVNFADRGLSTCGDGKRTPKRLFGISKKKSTESDVSSFVAVPSVADSGDLRVAENFMRWSCVDSTYFATAVYESRDRTWTSSTKLREQPAGRLLFRGVMQVGEVSV